MNSVKVKLNLETDYQHNIDVNVMLSRVPCINEEISYGRTYKVIKVVHCIFCDYDEIVAIVYAINIEEDKQ